MKKIISYFPLLYVCYVYFSYTNLYYYYREFNIDIVSFVTIVDVLFLFTPKIIILSSSFYFYVLYFIINRQEETNKLEIVNENRFLKMSALITFYLMANSVFSLIFLTFKWHAYQFDWVLKIFDFVFIVLSYFSFVKYDKDSPVFNNQLLLIIGVICLVTYKIGQYSVFTANKVKSNLELAPRNVSFVYNKDTINTDKNLILIGQTSNSVFIYDKIDKSTYAYPIDKIEHFKIK